MSSSTDKLFTQPIEHAFEFNSDVALVFDDMLDRSVPFYKEIINLGAQHLSKLLPKHATVLDLGCSTANMFIALHHFRKDFHFFGIDNANAMIEQAHKKCRAFNIDVTLYVDDIIDAPFGNANAIISNFTLQFIRPREREQLIRKIHNALEDEGYFLFAEKILLGDKHLDKHAVDIYYDYKKSKGYSEYEIAQKREALENVLVPYTMNENRAMVLDNGFHTMTPLFQWNNFALFLAQK